MMAYEICSAGWIQDPEGAWLRSVLWVGLILLLGSCFDHNFKCSMRQNSMDLIPISTGQSLRNVSFIRKIPQKPRECRSREWILLGDNFPWISLFLHILWAEALESPVPDCFQSCLCSERPWDIEGMSLWRAERQVCLLCSKTKLMSPSRERSARFKIYYKRFGVPMFRAPQL